MNSINIIIGNISSLLAMGTDSLASAQKTAKGVLWMQTLGQAIYCGGALILKGYSGAMQNIVSIARNLFAIGNIKSKALEWILLFLGVALGLIFNNLGFMGLLPVIANLQYTISVFRFKDNQRALKISFAINSFLYSVFNLAIYNFVGVVTNLVVVCVTIFFLIKGKKST